MRTRNFLRWLMAAVCVPMMTMVFGTSSCSFTGQGEGDLDDDGGVIIIDEP